MGIAAGRAAGPAAAPQLGASATIVPAGLHTDGAIGLSVHRDLATVHAALNRQAQAFAALCLALALVCAGMLAWSQARRAGLRQAADERTREHALRSTPRVRR